MSNWIYGKDLIEHWEIKGFELVIFCKQGLQAYDRVTGRKIVNSDRLPRKRRFSYEEILKLTRVGEGAKNTWGVLVPGRMREPKPKFLTEDEIKQAAKTKYSEQPLDVIEVPEDCIAMSFTIPSDQKKL